MLDVGCGAGHWGQRLLPHIAPAGVLQGVDHEPDFIGLATTRAADLGLAARCRYHPGTAEDLPFPDASFDLVTCQTVLQHVADPRVALSEMGRVLRPGGLLLLSEADNAASMVALAGRSPPVDAAELVDRLRLHLTIAAGKRTLGWGDDDIGGRLPGLLKELGMVDIHAHLNDHCAPLWPPYASPAQQAELAQLTQASSLGAIDDTDARRAFERGGGDPAAFDRLWQVEADAQHSALTLAKSGQLSRPGGVVHYLVGGRRPPPPTAETPPP